MATHLVVVTGGSSGIGRAVLATAPAGATRIDVSRSGSGLAHVRHLRADLSDPDSWRTVGDAVAAEVRGHAWRRVTIVQAAGTLAPIGYAGEVDAGDYTVNVLLNSAAPQVLGHRFLAALRDVDATRELVMLSSGAARTAYAGWSSYGAAKAAVDQWVRTVGAEQADRGGIRVLSVAPGVVASGMQDLIRSSSERDFPRVERFRRLHDQGELRDPTQVAGRLWALLDEDVTTGSVVDLRERA